MIITESDINEYVKKVYCYNGANAYKVDRVVLHRTVLDSTLDMVSMTLYLKSNQGNIFIDTLSVRKSKIVRYIREKKLKGIFND